MNKLCRKFSSQACMLLMGLTGKLVDRDRKSRDEMQTKPCYFCVYIFIYQVWCSESPRMQVSCVEGWELKFLDVSDK